MPQTGENCSVNCKFWDGRSGLEKTLNSTNDKENASLFPTRRTRPICGAPGLNWPVGDANTSWIPEMVPFGSDFQGFGSLPLKDLVQYKTPHK